MRSFVIFCSGIGVAAPQIHRAARTNKFVAVKGECWERSKKTSWPLGGGCILTFENFPQICRRKPAVEAKHGFFETKNGVWLKLRQATAPRHAKLTKVCLIVQKKHFFKICPKLWIFAVQKIGSEKNTYRTKHVNKFFTGLSWDFWGNSVYVCFLPHQEWPEKTHKQIFGTHPVPGQSRKFVYVYVFFLQFQKSGVKVAKGGFLDR